MTLLPLLDAIPFLSRPPYPTLCHFIRNAILVRHHARLVVSWLVINITLPNPPSRPSALSSRSLSMLLSSLCPFPFNAFPLQRPSHRIPPPPCPYPICAPIPIRILSICASYCPICTCCRATCALKTSISFFNIRISACADCSRRSMLRMYSTARESPPPPPPPPPRLPEPILPLPGRPSSRMLPALLWAVWPAL